jgi:hypothetical protein
MQTIKTALLAGATAVLLCGALNMAAAQSATHVLTVRLPGGAVEQIRYSGNVPPEVVVAPDAAPFAFGWPAAFFDPAPFATLDRISVEMDRQMAAMLRNANALAAESWSNPRGATEIGSGPIPAGSESYSFISTGSGNGMCGRSVQITSNGNGQKPHVVSRSWGNCGSSGPGVQSSVPPADQPSDVREINYVPPNHSGAIREASLR